MGMPITGEYSINFYDKYGAKDKRKAIHAGCFIQAKEDAQVVLNTFSPLKSFSIDRRIYNSLDKED